jgi:hypothetical protein
MRHRLHPACRSAATLLAFTLLPVFAGAASHKPSDYPLRVHIYRRVVHSHHTHGLLTYVEGDGRANLFENSEPKGIDFTYVCGERFMTSSGFETYPARWKKPGESLVLLMREVGSDATDTCELKVDVKNFVYVSRNGTLMTEPPEVLKTWMNHHQYDPEHGLDVPINMQKSPDPETPPAPVVEPKPE